jgi:hypothetical protein
MERIVLGALGGWVGDLLQFESNALQWADHANDWQPCMISSALTLLKAVFSKGSTEA